MAEKKIRQSDLQALENGLKLYVQQEIDRRIWMLIKIFTVPLIGATVKVLELLKSMAENLQ